MGFIIFAHRLVTGYLGDKDKCPKAIEDKARCMNDREESKVRCDVQMFSSLTIICFS